MKRSHVVLGVSAVACVAFYAFNRPYAPTPASLAARALTATAADDRANAIVEMTSLKEPEVTSQLQRVLDESHDAKVQVAAIFGLSARTARGNLPCLYKAMNHDEKSVRQAAYTALMKYWGDSLPGELVYSVDDPKEKRTEVTSRLKDLYDNPKGGLIIASASPAASSPVATPSPSPSSEAATSAPSPAATPSIPLAPAVGPVGQYESPSLNLLSWLCRILAVIVLVAEFAGAFGLVFGELNLAKRSRKDASHAKKIQPTVADEVEKILAKNSTGLWTKVGMLVAGAISVVGLLIVAELIPLVVSVQQTALRVEQTAGYVGQTAAHMDQTAVRVEQKLEGLRK